MTISKQEDFKNLLKEYFQFTDSEIAEYFKNIFINAPFLRRKSKLEHTINLGTFLYDTYKDTVIYKITNFAYAAELAGYQLDSAQNLKDFFVIFNAFPESYDLVDGKLLYNKIINGTQITTDMLEGNRSKKWPVLDKEEAFNKKILPFLQKYYSNFRASTDVDTVIKESVRKWYDSQTPADFVKKIDIISDALRDNPTATDINVDVEGSKNITINVQRFFTALFTGVYSTGKFSKQKVKRTETIDDGNGVLRAVEVEDEIEVSENLQNVFEALGYSDYLVDQSEINGFFTANKIPPTVEALQYAETADPQLYQQIIEKTLQLPPLDEEGKINLKQCALITGLLHNDNEIAVDFQRYFENPDYASPLKPGGLESRIYCVGTNIAGFDPNQFVNLCTIDPAIKPTLQNQADSQNPNGIQKFLFWVYKGKDGLREVQLPITDQQEFFEARDRLRRLRKGQAYLNTASEVDQSKRKAEFQTLVSDTSVTEERIEEEIHKALISVLNNNNQQNTVFFLKEANIKFEGTNPSTARSDVQVTLSFDMASIADLDHVIATLSGQNDGLPEGETIQIRIMDLITISSTNKTSVIGEDNNLASNAYSPDYSRLRLKICPTSLDQNVLTLDIATIDHQVSRDSSTGRTTLTINYRGYFETVMSMPFNDALADNDIMLNRWNRQQTGLAILNKANCRSSTIREAMRIETENLAREGRKAGFSSILKRLNSKGNLHQYSLLPKYKSSRYGNVLDPRQNYVAYTYNKTFTNVTDEQIDGYRDENNKILKLDADKQKTSAQNDVNEVFGDKDMTLGHFFFLGDLMHVVSDCLYTNESGAPKHQDWVKDLNLRFILSTISIPNPKDLDGAPLQINPACIPIDVHFFVQWFNSVVVNKNLSYYPVGVFMRDLIERLVNNIIQETCFSLLLPDQTPAQLRMGFFTDDSTIWFQRDITTGWFNPKDPFRSNRIPPFSERPLFKRALSSEALKSGSSSLPIKSKNYCVIYQQFPSFFSQLQSSRNGSLKTDPYTISLYYGIHNVDHNFLSNVSFSKTNSPYLREARYFSNSYGSLSLLSNVYDLSFSFVRRKANTFFFPGNIVNFYLLDWLPTDTKNKTTIFDSNNPPWNSEDEQFGQSNPHKNGTIANILGMGGYFVVLSVEYVLGETSGEFEIKIATKFVGTDAAKDKKGEDPNKTNIEDSPECAEAFNVIANRANELYESGDELFQQAQAANTGNAEVNQTVIELNSQTDSTGKYEQTTLEETTINEQLGESNEEKIDEIEYGESTPLTPEDDEAYYNNLRSQIIDITGFYASTSTLKNTKIEFSITKDNYLQSGRWAQYFTAISEIKNEGRVQMEDGNYIYIIFVSGEQTVINAYNKG